LRKLDSAVVKWLFVGTAWSGMAHALPAKVLKPLATYFGLPLDARPLWWLVLETVVVAGLVFLVVAAFRRQGAPRIVATGSILFVLISLAIWAIVIGGFKAVGAPTEELLADARLPWPLWLFRNGLFVGASFAAAHLTPPTEPAPPGKSWMVGSWIWVGLLLFALAVAVWTLYMVREILGGIEI